MRRHFKAVRLAFVMAVLTIVGAVGGVLTRGHLSNRDSNNAGTSESGPVAQTSQPVGLDAPSLNATGLNATDSALPSSSQSAALPSQNLLKAAPPKTVARGQLVPTHSVGTQAAANTLAQGDLMLEEGRVSEAVRFFRYLLATAAAEHEMMNVWYRVALCAEALGNEEDALAAYQRVAEVADGKLLGELALLGQARVLAAGGETDPAQLLLGRWLLSENETSARSLPVSRDAMFLLGVVLSEASLRKREPRLWENDGLARPRSSFEPSDYLPGSFATDVAERADIPVGLKMLHQLQVSEPGSSYFQGRLARTSVQRVLQQICATPGWRIEYTPVAESTVRANTVQLDFAERTGDLLLDLLLAPLGACWTFADGELRIIAQSELTDEEREHYRRAMAERTLFAALLSEPEHGQSPVAYLLLGNLAFREGDMPTARRHFENVLKTYPRSAVEAEAWFNASKVALAQGDLARQRQTLLGAVDAGRGDPLEPVALMLSGRNALLFDEPLVAVRPLLRAVTLAADPDVRALSLLTLASAHLIAERPEGANVALMEDRRLLRGDAYRDRAALLASLARFRAGSTKWRIDRDGRSLITALSHDSVKSWMALHDHLLTVDAYQELELNEMALPVLESAIESANPSPMRTRMQFRLAQLLESRGESQRAEVVLTAMTDDPSPEVSSRSMLALADLHVSEREFGRAEQICRDMLERTLSEKQRIAVLRLLGGIYAKRGDRKRAVLCYSGVAPQLYEATLLAPDVSAGELLPDGGHESHTGESHTHEAHNHKPDISDPVDGKTRP